MLLFWKILIKIIQTSVCISRNLKMYKNNETAYKSKKTQACEIFFVYIDDRLRHNHKNVFEQNIRQLNISPIGTVSCMNGNKNRRNEYQKSDDTDFHEFVIMDSSILHCKNKSSIFLQKNCLRTLFFKRITLFCNSQHKTNNWNPTSGRLILVYSRLFVLSLILIPKLSPEIIFVCSGQDSCYRHVINIWIISKIKWFVSVLSFYNIFEGY